jgi:hypothetical protein
MTRGKGTMRSSPGRRGLGSMWKIHFRGPLANSVDLRLYGEHHPPKGSSPGREAVTGHNGLVGRGFSPDDRCKGI